MTHVRHEFAKEVFPSGGFRGQGSTFRGIKGFGQKAGEEAEFESMNYRTGSFPQRRQSKLKPFQQFRSQVRLELLGRKLA